MMVVAHRDCPEPTTLPDRHTKIGQVAIDAGIHEEINCLDSRVQGLEARVRELELRKYNKQRQTDGYGHISTGYETYDAENPCASF